MGAGTWRRPLLFGSSRVAERMHEYQAYLSALDPDEVGRLTPDAKESPRSVKLHLSRAALQCGMNAETWIADGAVYFRVTAPAS